jgi:hypothetical protein
MTPSDSNPTREQLAARWPIRLAAVPWDFLGTAYGRATRTPDQLMDLLDDDWETAFQASHDLWCSLCHQHAYVSSAALPALPFLLEALELGDDRLAVEILDILAGFAICTAPPSRTGPFATPSDSVWAVELRRRLQEERSRFEALRESAEGEVAEFADWVLEAL